MDLNEILVFIPVVAGSFVAASRALGIPKSAVSINFGELEERSRCVRRDRRRCGRRH